MNQGVKIDSQGSRSPPEAYSPSSKTSGGVPMPMGTGTDEIRSVPAKPVRLTVFGKAYSVPYRRVNKRDALLLYLDQIPSVAKMLKQTGLLSRFGVEGLLEQERWELRNDEGDAIRLDDWEEMVGPDSKIHLVENRENEPFPSEDWGRLFPASSSSSSTSYRDSRFSHHPEEREFSKPPRSSAYEHFHPRMHGAASGGIHSAASANIHSASPRPSPARVTPNLIKQEFESASIDRLFRATSAAASDINSSNPSSGTQSDRPSSIVICAYTRLKVPTLYPPTNAKVVKCSFGPATPYWRALKALSEGNVTTNTRLQILHIRYNQDHEKMLVAGRTVVASRDLTLQELGFGDLEDGQEMIITRFV